MKAFFRAIAWLRAGWQDGTEMPSAQWKWWAAFWSLAIFFFVASWQRYSTFHNTTFDLAFYARISWAMARFQGWEPITNADFFGLHLAWILWPLAFVGRLFGHVPVLLAAQACAFAACIFPVRRLASRWLGQGYAPVAAACFFLHPNVFAVASSEFHPGSLGVFPLLALCDAVDRKSLRGFLVFSVMTLLCREDFALMLFCAAMIFVRLDARQSPTTKRVLTPWMVFLVLYFACFVFVLQPRFGPRHAGSLQLHFGALGNSSSEIAANLMRKPWLLLEHLMTPNRLRYLPTVLITFAFLPALYWPSLWIAAPVLAINLISGFPTTMDMDEHYLTPALPALFWGALHGAARLRSWKLDKRVLSVVWLTGTVWSAWYWGKMPGAREFSSAEFTPDARTWEGQAVTRQIGHEASVQGPDMLLPHVAERFSVRRGPPPEHRTEYVALSVAHRGQHLGQETLLRTDEEDLLRAWLSRSDHAVVYGGQQLFLMRRDVDPRSGVGFREVHQTPEPSEAARITDCLDLIAWNAPAPDVVELHMRARGECPADLAVRLGPAKRSRHVYLLREGLLSPAHLRAGDTWTQRFPTHGVDPHNLYLAAIRASGARPLWRDPIAVPLRALERPQ